MESIFQDMWATASPALWALAAFSVMLAGILRAFTGFGFALIAVPVLGIIFPPQVAVPIVVGLEVVSGAGLLPGARAETDWRLFRILALTALLTLPLGIWLLTLLDDAAMRLLLSAILVISVGLFAIAAKAKNSGAAPGPLPTAISGLSSGVMVGVSGIPGPPIVAYLMGTGLEAARQRATLIAYFIVIDSAAVLGFYITGALDLTILAAILLMIPTMVLGNVLGTLAFRRFGEVAWQPIAFGTILVIAAGLVARAIL